MQSLTVGFLMRLLKSGEKDIERMSTLKEDILCTVCELKTLIFSASVRFNFNATCLTVTTLITKSCQQHWPIHSCSFDIILQGSALAGGRF